MENKIIELTITENDGFLYEFIKDCKNIEYVKMYLRYAAELYRFCNSDCDIQKEHLNPENYRVRILKSKTKAELIKIKNELEKDILLYVSDFHPDECDYGIMRGLDTEYRFINENSRLGFIILYSNYIKMINDILKEKTTND